MGRKSKSTENWDHILEEVGVVAEDAGVVGVGFDGPLVHLLRPVIITTHILKEKLSALVRNLTEQKKT